MTQTLIDAAVAAVTVGGCLWGIARWTARVDRNTEATDKLTASFDSFSDKVTGTLTDHEVRIKLLERDH